MLLSDSYFEWVTKPSVSDIGKNYINNIQALCGSQRPF